MLQNCIKIFEKHTNMDKLILDTYMPADGTYLIMEESNTDFIKKELLEIKQDKKTRTLGITEEEKYRVSYYDYYSKLIDMNKPIDSKKNIQSNNYLSFWIKKDSITSKKLTNEIIDRYYVILSNPYIKYSKSKNDMELYSVVENELGDINQDKLEKIKNWIKGNIFDLQIDMSGKNYLKIFFVCNGTDFEEEGRRYMLPNIFNKNDYNITIDDIVLGLPNENMGLNTKKPYLENKSRKITVPILTNTNQIMTRKKFFDYLWNLSSSGKSNVYFNIEDNAIKAYDFKEAPSSDFSGYYLRIRKDKNEAAIIDMDIITSYQPELKIPIIIEDVIGIDDNKLYGHAYGRITKLYEVKEIINEELFSNYLIPNFYTEANDMSVKDSAIKECILIARSVLFNWFYKGYENGIKEIIDSISLKLIRNSISKNYSDKVRHQFNVRISLLEYFKGGNRKMADVMKEIREDLKLRINSKEYDSITTDEEYYYAIGQIIRYFISLNKSTKKNHSLFNPFLNIKNDKILKSKINIYFKKYNYSIEEKSLRFNNLYNLIISYQPKSGVNSDYMIAGYISNSLIYEKKEDK